VSDNEIRFISLYCPLFCVFIALWFVPFGWFVRCLNSLQVAGLTGSAQELNHNSPDWPPAKI